MANTDDDVQHLVDSVLRGELVLPDIQRDFVWSGRQIPRFLDSLNKQWPVGAILTWNTSLDVPIKPAAILQEQPRVRPAILLDGQQRLTTLARVFHPDRVPPGDRPPDVRYNPRTGEFANANAVLAKDPVWLRASDFLQDGAQFREVVKRAGVAEDQADEDVLVDEINRVAKNIRGYRFLIQTLDEDDYEQVAEIFNRVNTGGRRLSKGDLVLGALAARWPGGRDRIEDFEAKLSSGGWRFNREVLLRITSVLALGSPNHVRLVELGDAVRWQRAWADTEAAVLHAVEFLKRDVHVPNLSLLPSEYVVVLLATVMHRQAGTLEPGQARALERWVLLASAFGHYSGSTETRLAADRNRLVSAASPAEGLEKLITTAQEPRTPGAAMVAADLLGKGLKSPLLRTLQLIALKSGAQTWWSHRALSYDAELPRLKVEVHHVFPKAYMRRNGLGRHRELDTLANFAFLSKYDNIKISDDAPSTYLQHATTAELENQWVPRDPALWKAEAFDEFCTARRALMAGAINVLLSLSGAAEPEAPALADEGEDVDVGAWADAFENDPEAA